MGRDPLQLCSHDYQVVNVALGEGCHKLRQMLPSAPPAETGQRVTSARYRADIDGLRAVAVLCVIAFHFSVLDLPGGYLGVDVFFVISGYLITSIIWREMREGQFTLAHFYERRIRRILPALLVVLLATTLGAFLILLPGDLMGYARSLLATLVFLANVYFWRDTNYFARAAEEKPLLHAWSLGIEEQFYILFPLLLIVLAVRAPRQTVWVIAALIALSFVANVALIRAGGQSPAFYLLPTRIWELGAGALIAVLPATAAPGKAWAEAFAIVGIGLVALGVWLADRPSGALPKALPVVLGAAAIVWCGAAHSLKTTAWLRLPMMVLIGKMSYALYLWHWPVIVFAQYYLIRALTPVETLGALAVTTVLAALSWRFVETPFRGKTMRLRTVAVWLISVTCALALASLALLRAQGVPGRLPAAAAQINASAGTNYRCALPDYIFLNGARACRLHLPGGEVDDTRLALFGNSHAQMFAPLIAASAQADGTPAVLVPMNGCLPTPELNINARCSAMARQNLDALLALPELRTVVIAFNWTVQSRDLITAEGQPAQNVTSALTQALNTLITGFEARNVQVFVIGPLPVPGWDVASELSRSIAFGRPNERSLGTPAPEFAGRFAPITAALRARLGSRFIEPHKAICDDQTCHWIVEGASVFADATHLAAGQLHHFAPYFSEVRSDD